MKQGILKTGSVVMEPNTYLTIQLENDAKIVDFCVEMASRNNIPGLLPISRQFIDGMDMLYYNVTGLRNLSSVLNPALPTDAVLLLLRNLSTALIGLSEYFLHSTQCVLDLDCIYTSEHSQPGLALVPMAEDPEDGSEPLRKLFMDIMGRCTSRSNQNIYAPLMTCLIRPDFQLKEFADILNGMTAKPTQPVRGVARNDLNSQPHRPPVAIPKGAVVNTPSETAQAAPAQRPKGIPNVSPQGFAIPGGGQAVPVKDSVKEPRQPKKSILSFGRKKQEDTPACAASLIYNGRTVPLNKLPFTIGRSNCDFNIDDMRVSQPHATFLMNNGVLSIRDEESLNYTFVNERRITPFQPEPISDGAQLRLGPATFTFRLNNEG